MEKTAFVQDSDDDVADDDERKTTSNTLYSVAHNKPDYLVLLSKFCISTTKHISMIMYM